MCKMLQIEVDLLLLNAKHKPLPDNHKSYTGDTQGKNIHVVTHLSCWSQFGENNNVEDGSGDGDDN